MVLTNYYVSRLDLFSSKQCLLFCSWLVFVVSPLPSPIHCWHPKPIHISEHQKRVQNKVFKALGIAKVRWGVKIRNKTSQNTVWLASFTVQFTLIIEWLSNRDFLCQWVFTDKLHSICAFAFLLPVCWNYIQPASFKKSSTIWICFHRIQRLWFVADWLTMSDWLWHWGLFVCLLLCQYFTEEALKSPLCILKYHWTQSTSQLKAYAYNSQWQNSSSYMASCLLQRYLA